MTDYNATLMGMSQCQRDAGTGIMQYLNLFGSVGRLDHTNGWRMDVMGNSAAGDYLLTRNETSKFVRRGAVTTLVADPTSLPPDDRSVEGSPGPVRPPPEWFIYNDPVLTIKEQ
jgi:hypothetical protein